MCFKKKVCVILFILFFTFLFSADDEIIDNKNIDSYDKSSTEKNITESEETKPIDDEFYSIQSKSLTACHGDKWFLQEYDDYGKIILSVLYEKNKLIEKREYFYTNGYKSGLDIYLDDKLIKIQYNKAGYEIENKVYDKNGAKLQKHIKNEYDKNNLLLKTSLKKNGTEWLSVFTFYADKKKKTQTDFINNQKTCFSEYVQGKKIVHLFQFGKEIKVLEEEY